MWTPGRGTTGPPLPPLRPESLPPKAATLALPSVARRSVSPTSPKTRLDIWTRGPICPQTNLNSVAGGRVFPIGRFVVGVKEPSTVGVYELYPRLLLAEYAKHSLLLRLPLQLL